MTRTFFRYIWSSPTVPKNALKPKKVKQCLVINEGDFWDPSQGQGLVARRINHVIKRLEISISPLSQGEGYGGGAGG